MTDKTEIEKLYNIILKEYKNSLEKYNVKMPKLYSNGNYTLNALVLIYLFSKIGEIVSKQELTDYVRTMGFDINDVQQARHLAQQSGWYILSGTRGDYECKNLGIKSGEYMLKTIKEPYPSYKNLKRTETLNAGSWDELKKCIIIDVQLVDQKKENLIFYTQLQLQHCNKGIKIQVCL